MWLSYFCQSVCEQPVLLGLDLVKIRDALISDLFLLSINLPSKELRTKILF